ncbi:T9SS type A sorting domain-containing protein [Tamlana sp. I1]|uniref:T9SS type A sorting domain-containing protein n=1 Tax=Tamlana sp. I1 TaxID=2762061 RepID=UPI00188DF2EA|nr:T9SS type A sorting domain-containing protein [Tamlana sp. I1]
MDFPKSLLILVVSLCLNFSYSQTGPGGVGNTSSNGLWLKAENVNLSDGAAIPTWLDASGNNNNATATSGQQPNFQSSSDLNGMPTVRFDGTNDQMSILDADILDGTEGMTYFAVIRPNNLDNAPRGILGKRISYTTSTDYAYTWFFHNQQGINVDINTQNDRLKSLPINFSNDTNYIMQMHFDGSLTASQRLKTFSGQTMTSEGKETSTMLINSNSNLVLGALNLNYNTYLGADMSEIIHYNYALNAAERIIVNNYLSAKYNIALASEDYYKMDDFGNGEFDFNVAGIGQAADGSSHTDSQGSGIVRINNPTDLDPGDDEFLFWGEKTNSSNYQFVTTTDNNYEQLNSTWRFDEEKSVGDIDISFDISVNGSKGIDLSEMPSCATLQLVYDNDEDFSTILGSEIFDLTITGNTAIATGIKVSSKRYFTLRYAKQDEIIWDGANFTGGSGTNNAPDNINDTCKKLIIESGEVTLTENAHVDKIEVKPGAILNIASGIFITAETRITIDGTLNLLGEAQLIQKHNQTSKSSGSGNLTVSQQGTANLHNYNLWSAPVNTAGNWHLENLEDEYGIVVNFTTSHDAVYGSPLTLSSYWLHSFNGLSDNYSHWNQISPTSALPPGYGYTMKGSGASSSLQSYTFRGTANDGNYSLSATAGNDILIGNPYPSALDANQFIEDNLSVIDGTLYFWEQFGEVNSHLLADYEGGYATYTKMMGTPAVSNAAVPHNGSGSPDKGAPTQFIPIGQGFFVTVINSGTLIFNNAQRAFATASANGTVFFKTNSKSKTQQTQNADNRPKLWFKLTEPNGRHKTIGLGYDSQATHNFDKGYDAKSYDNLDNDWYWVSNNEKLVIQALPEINIQDELPLEVKVTHAGSYAFSIRDMHNIPSTLDIYLKDNIQNTYYNLKEKEVALTLDANTDANQFSIVFQKDSTLDTEIKNEANAHTSYNASTKTLTLHPKEAVESSEYIQIYSTLGQEVLTLKQPKSNAINVSQLTDGVYVLKIKSKNQKQVTSIKFVKY